MVDSTLNRSDGVLMPPPAPRPPKRRAVVLEEEDWVAAMEGIIERDFFPELATLKDKVEWLEAVRGEDVQKLQAVQQRMGERERSRVTTPTPTTINTTGEPQTTYPPQAPPPLSLDTFLRIHDSEDNARFKVLLEQANKKRKERARHLLPSSIPPTADGREKTDGFGTSGQPTDTLISWRHRPINLLMYDGSTQESLPLSTKELRTGGAAPGPGAESSINHRATRFGVHNRKSGVPHGNVQEESGVQGSFLTGDVGGDETDGEVSNRQGGSGQYDILATPSLEPGVDVSPFMTWGDIEATPQLIEMDEERRNPVEKSFRIQETPQREQTAHNLAKLAKSKTHSGSSRKQHGTPASFAGTPIAISPSLSGAGNRFSNRMRHQKDPKKLSDAGRRLVESLRLHRGNLPVASSELQLDPSLRATYGATPHRNAHTPVVRSEWERDADDRFGSKSGVGDAKSWTPAGDG